MKKTAKELQFQVLIEQDEDGWYVASVPELPGCYTQGKTIEQARERIQEAITLVLRTEPDIKKEKISNPHPLHRFFGVEDVSIRYA